MNTSSIAAVRLHRLEAARPAFAVRVQRDRAAAALRTRDFGRGRCRYARMAFSDDSDDSKRKSRAVSLFGLYALKYASASSRGNAVERSMFRIHSPLSWSASGGAGLVF